MREAVAGRVRWLGEGEVRGGKPLREARGGGRAAFEISWRRAAPARAPDEPTAEWGYAAAASDGPCARASQSPMSVRIFSITLG